MSTVQPKVGRLRYTMLASEWIVFHLVGAVQYIVQYTLEQLAALSTTVFYISAHGQAT